MPDLPVCIHRGPLKDDGRYVCRTDRLIHSGTVSPEICVICPYADKPLMGPQGLGDTVHAVLKATGISAIFHWLVGDCSCSRRKAWLNWMLPYKKKD